MINKVYEHERVKRKIEAIGSKRVRERESKRKEQNREWEIVFSITEMNI